MVLQPNFGMRLHLYLEFQCTKFQGNRIMPLCFIATFTPLGKGKKEEKKNEETQPTFEGSYLGNAWHGLFEM